MPKRSAKKDSRRLMRMGYRLKKVSKVVMILMVLALLFFGLITFSQNPLLSTVLLVSGAVGVVGIVALTNRNVER